MHVSKSKANIAYICGDVFVCNYQFVMTFNACFTVVMNKLTDDKEV